MHTLGWLAGSKAPSLPCPVHICTDPSLSPQMSLLRHTPSLPPIVAASTSQGLFHLLPNSPSQREAKVETQDRPLKQTSQREAAYGLAPCLVRHWPFYAAQAPLPRAWCHPQGALALLHGLAIQKVPPQTVLLASTAEAIPQLRFPLPRCDKSMTAISHHSWLSPFPFLFCPGPQSRPRFHLYSHRSSSLS